MKIAGVNIIFFFSGRIWDRNAHVRHVIICQKSFSMALWATGHVIEKLDRWSEQNKIGELDWTGMLTIFLCN